MEQTNLERFMELVGEFKTDYSKFNEKGNKTAGTRARKALQEIRNLSKEIRNEISATKRATA